MKEEPDLSRDIVAELCLLKNEESKLSALLCKCTLGSNYCWFKLWVECVCTQLPGEGGDGIQVFGKTTKKKKRNFCVSINTSQVCWRSREIMVEKCQSHMEKSVRSPNMFTSKLQQQFVHRNEALFWRRSSYLYQRSECQTIKEDIFLSRCFWKTELSWGWWNH